MCNQGLTEEERQKLQDVRTAFATDKADRTRSARATDVLRAGAILAADCRRDLPGADETTIARVLLLTATILNEMADNFGKRNQKLLDPLAETFAAAAANLTST